MAMSGSGNETPTVAEVVLERREMEERDCIVEKGEEEDGLQNLYLLLIDGLPIGIMDIMLVTS